MSLIKSFSVGNGDMFYIRHGNDAFTIIDCCLDDRNADRIISEIEAQSKDKGVVRFISTHPDDDHIRGLDLLDDRLGLRNFYCVENGTTKEDDTACFTRYCELRKSDKAYHLKKGCSRKWLNESNDERKSSGITVLWPDTTNDAFKQVLKSVEDGGSPNNLSPIVQYSIGETTVLWMGDLETEFLETIKDSLTLPRCTILFAPHHGRYSGRVPDSMLKIMAPRLIVIGEAPSEHLHYYDGYDTITQNTAGDLVFDCEGAQVHLFTANKYKPGFLASNGKSRSGLYYAGTLAA